MKFDFLKRVDFWLRAAACFMIAAAVAMVLADTCLGNGVTPVLGGFAAGIAAGLGKEYGHSKAEGNRWSWTGVLADVFGSVVGCQLGWAALLI